MSSGRFKISIHWKNRPETAQACARRLEKMMSGLSTIHPSLAQWYMEAKRKGKASVPIGPLSTDIGELITFFEKGRHRKDNGALWPELGYHVFGWNGVDGPNGVGFTAMPGIYNDTRDLPNSVDLEFQPRQTPNADFQTVEVMRSALVALVSAWEPDWGAVSTWDYWDKRIPPPQHWPVFRSGWMTYLSAPYARKVTPPPLAITEPVVGGGILMLATNEPFAIDNPQHVAVADAIQACLEPLQSDPRLERS